MRYKENWKKTQKHFEAFWNNCYDERCNLAMTVPRSDRVPLNKEFSVAESYIDPDCMHQMIENRCQNTLFLGEALPVLNLNFGTAGHCAYYGCQPHYTPETIWFDPILDEADSSLLQFSEKGKNAYRTHKNIGAALAKRSQNAYFVSMPDNCGITDCLAEIRGTENLLTDMLENPEFVHEAMEKMIALWRETQTGFFDLLADNNQGGSTHSWMQLWDPGRHVQIQCDYSVMISPAMFEEFVLPELEATAGYFDHTTYHLDGVEQLRHLDMILSVKGITNIQWTPVDGQPKTSENIKALQKIQRAGKGLVLMPQLDEVRILMENLSHNGLHLVINGVKSREEARDIERLAIRLAHSTIGG